MSFNFGFEFRQGWWRNYSFVSSVAVFSFFHYYAALVPGYISCLWRVNCDDDHAVFGVTRLDPDPINNPFHTTVMPVDFRWTLVILMLSNTICVMGWEYLINKFRQFRSRSSSASLKVRGDFEMVPAHEGVTV